MHNRYDAHIKQAYFVTKMWFIISLWNGRFSKGAASCSTAAWRYTYNYAPMWRSVSQLHKWMRNSSGGYLVAQGQRLYVMRASYGSIYSKNRVGSLWPSLRTNSTRKMNRQGCHNTSEAKGTLPDIVDESSRSPYDTLQDWSVASINQDTRINARILTRGWVLSRLASRE